MFVTPGIEVSASAIVDEAAAITHQVGLDGSTEIQFGGHTGFYLVLSEQALRKLHEASIDAINTIDGTGTSDEAVDEAVDEGMDEGVGEGVGGPVAA